MDAKKATEITLRNTKKLSFTERVSTIDALILSAAKDGKNSVVITLGNLMIGSRWQWLSEPEIDQITQYYTEREFTIDHCGDVYDRWAPHQITWPVTPDPSDKHESPTIENDERTTDRLPNKIEIPTRRDDY